MQCNRKIWRVPLAVCLVGINNQWTRGKGTPYLKTLFSRLSFLSLASLSTRLGIYSKANSSSPFNDIDAEIGLTQTIQNPDLLVGAIHELPLLYLLLRKSY